MLALVLAWFLLSIQAVFKGSALPVLPTCDEHIGAQLSAEVEVGGTSGLLLMRPHS